MALQPKDFTQINKSLIKKSVNGEHIQDKEIRKKLDGIRKKVKQGHKHPKIDIQPNKDRIYGLASPKHEDIADIIYNTYGNKAEEDLKKNYEAFIAKKSKVYHRPKVVPRFINPKVEELKKKEEEKKKNNLDAAWDDEEIFGKKDDKPLYKLKMFQSVGSKIAESIKQFKTYKLYKKTEKKKINDNGIDNLINKVQEEIKQKENENNEQVNPAPA